MAKIHPPVTIESTYARKLRKVAMIVGHIIEAHTEITKEGGSITGVMLHEGLTRALRAYSQSLEPWAQRLSAEMIASVDRNNAAWWKATAKHLAGQLKSERATQKVGAVATQLQTDQVTLIKSLPIEAGERAQKIAMSASTEGRRASDIAAEIQASGEVTASRANTIARTEIAKAHASLNQARSESVGANKYIWRTMMDENTREAHAEMDGKVCDFDHPPMLSDGTEGNPGEFVNCRCYAEPVIAGLSDEV